MTTHETHDTTAPNTDPMSDSDPMGVSRAGDTRHGPGPDHELAATWVSPDGKAYELDPAAGWVSDAGVPTLEQLRKASVQMRLSGRHAPYDLNGRIPFDALTPRQTTAVFAWLLDRHVDPSRVDSGSIIGRDPVNGEWRIGLRRPDGTYVVVRRSDPRLRVATRAKDWVDLSPYLRLPAGASVHYARGGTISPTPTYADLGGCTIPRRQTHDDAASALNGGPVVSVKTSETYVVGEQLAARRLAAQMGVTLESSAGRRVND